MSKYLCLFLLGNLQNELTGIDKFSPLGWVDYIIHNSYLNSVNHNSTKYNALRAKHTDRVCLEKLKVTHLQNLIESYSGTVVIHVPKILNISL